MKISGLVISLIVVTMFVSIFGLYYASIGQQYGRAYNPDDLSAFNKTAELEAQMSEINATLQDIDPGQSGISDIVGAFFKSGYLVVRTTFTSIGIFNDMADAGFDRLEVAGSGLNIFKVTLIMIAVAIFFFLVVSVLIGREV